MPRLSRPARLPHLASAGAGAAALVLVALTCTAPASAAPASAAPAPVRAVDPPSAFSLSDPRVIAHFDFAAGQTPENIALEPDGSANLTFALARQVARVDTHGNTRILATLPTVANPDTPLVGVAVTTGIVRTRDGSLYVNYLTGHDEQSGSPTEPRTGVYRIAPDGSVELFAGLPRTSFANGLALDDEHGFLYAADSALGTVWRISLDDGGVTAWATGSALQPSGFAGANGIKVHHGAVWVSNLDAGTLLRIPVERDGSAGPIATRASGLAGIDDFEFTGQGDSVLAALHASSQVALVRPDGTHSIVLEPGDGLSNPTSVAVRHHKVYVPSAAFTTMRDPNLLLARIDKHRP